MDCLGHRLLIPDVVVEELLTPIAFAESQCNAEVKELPAKGMRQVIELSAKHRQLSAADLFALALAKMENGVLLTGDRQLRLAAGAEGVLIKGTLGVIDALVAANCISTLEAQEALKAIMRKNTRLPNAECMLRLNRWNSSI